MDKVAARQWGGPRKLLSFGVPHAPPPKMSSVGTAPPLGSQSEQAQPYRGQGAKHSQGRSSEPAWPWHSPTFAREAGQLWPTLEGPIGVDSAEIWQLLYVHGLGPPRKRQASSVMLSREQRMLLALMGWVPGASLVHRAIH